jgi:hypothetical protein
MTVERMFVFHFSRHAERGAGNTRDDVELRIESSGYSTIFQAGELPFVIRNL